jgi:hypothetical protein
MDQYTATPGRSRTGGSMSSLCAQSGDGSAAPRSRAEANHEKARKRASFQADRSHPGGVIPSTLQVLPSRSAGLVDNPPPPQKAGFRTARADGAAQQKQAP